MAGAISLILASFRRQTGLSLHSYVEKSIETLLLELLAITAANLLCGFGCRFGTAKGPRTNFTKVTCAGFPVRLFGVASSADRRLA